jgi:hypothetical protein
MRFRQFRSTIALQNVCAISVEEINSLQNTKNPEQYALEACKACIGGKK